MVDNVRVTVSLEKLNPYYDEAGNLLNFTRQERIVIYFLIVTLGLGAVLKLVRNRNLDTNLRPTRFYEEEQRFKEISAQINSTGLMTIIESSDETDPAGVEITEPKSVSSAAGSAKVNINTAAESELTELPGIGPAIAKRIKTYTDLNGPFKNKAEVVLVKGIGEKLYARIEGLVTLE
ncbi:MAG: helix-hairpin-helix domain-containing protein [Candidatus Marinimicrobia bacterium]|nr:helix-hairpin-helix domain-containing protein [Candidatus Neomarinimicrobiota bacterium]